MIVPALFVGGLFYVTWRGSPLDVPVAAETVLSGNALGTTWTVKLVDGADVEAARTSVESALALVDEQMSTYRSDSELMQLNAHTGEDAVTVSLELATVLNEAIEIGNASGGSLDVTVGPLVEIWGFGRNKHERVPSEDEIAQIRSHVGLDKISVQNQQVTKRDGETQIDLSAIAKGFVVDQIAEGLIRLGHTDMMVEVGGEIVARGTNIRGDVWRFGIEQPSEGERSVYKAVPLRNGAMATSGDYRNVYFVDDRRVSHLIDPRTAAPIEHSLASVTVLGERCSTADAWATALLVLGETEGPIIAEQQGIAAHFIVREEDGSFISRTTPAFDALP
jgi:thiamine biosynthesis lipoprotein